MIRRFRHKGLERLYAEGDARGVESRLVPRLERALAVLDRARRPADVALPGFRLHLLRGELDGCWSIAVSANWRLVFRFDDLGVYDVDLVDYH